MYEKEMIDVLNAKVKELEKKNTDLEDRHWNECGQIAYYEQELKAFRDGYFRELDTNLCNKQYIENLKERYDIAKRVSNSMYGLKSLHKKTASVGDTSECFDAAPNLTPREAELSMALTNANARIKLLEKKLAEYGN